MFAKKKSLIISNIYDPLSRKDEDLKVLYPRLAKQNRYDAWETRPIKDPEMITFFNRLKPECLSVEYYVTGDLARAGLSLSAEDEENRQMAVKFCMESLREGEKTGMNYLGIASGAITGNALFQLEQFTRSVQELAQFIQANHYQSKLCLEPLDQFAHKKNVIGSIDFTSRFINKLEAIGVNENVLVLTFDAAHVALNEDDFETFIRLFAKYIVKIHFANAVLDYHDPLYGDLHLDFNVGFMGMECARRIVRYAETYIDHPVAFACEVRSKDKNECAALEDKMFAFLSEALA